MDQGTQDDIGHGGCPDNRDDNRRGAELLKDFLQSFFLSKGKPQPIYFWVTVFLFLISMMLLLKVVGIVIEWIQTGKLDLSVQLLALVLGYVVSLITLYNIDRWKQGNSNKDDFGGV